MKKLFIFTLLLSILLNTNTSYAKNIKENKMNRTEICNENLSKLFNGMQLSNKGNDPEMMQILQKYIFGEVFTIGILSSKQREMITVTSLTVQQTLPQLKAHINGALNTGVTPIEIREVIYQCAPFIGFPKTLNAIAVMDEVFKERNIELPLKSTATVNENERYKKGSEIQKPLYGDEIKDAMAGLPKNMGDDAARFLTEVCFGDFYTRKGLDVKTRELLMISALTTTCNTSVLKSHIKGNLNVGNSVETVTAVVIQTMPYVGFPNAFEALRTIKEVMNEQANEISKFPVGQENTAYAKYFTGKSWLAPLTQNKNLNTPIFNVTFEPSCRNNWHSHTGGQILIAVGGVGYYQERGKKARKLVEGDIVEIAPNVEHWHGAAPDSYFSHLAIETNPQTNKNTWLEQVSDEDYKKATSEN